MSRLNFAIAAFAAVLLLCLASGPAFAKRRRAPRPAADATPATEVGGDASIAAMPSAPAATPTATEPAAERKPAMPAPAVSEQPRLPSASAAPAAVVAGEPSEAVSAAASAGQRPPARLSAHVGVGSPLVTLHATRANQHLGSVNEDLTLVAPIGLGLDLSDHWTFDFELQISTGVRPEGLTTAIVDPGVLYTWDALAAGVRVGWQLNANQNIGLIPLARLAILRNQRASWFVEASLPAFVRNKQVTTSAALQTGVAF
jgi:hypothetical protein